MDQEREWTTFEYDQTIRGLPGGFRFPARMTVLTLARGEVALVSPIPIDDALAARIAEQGRVTWLIAPNLQHHLYLRDAMTRYPKARVIGPPALRRKRPDLMVHDTLDAAPAALTDHVEIVRIDGAPSIDEFVFFHLRTRALIVTDLVFNVTAPRGFWANVVLSVVGCHGRLAATRVWRVLVKDRAATARSLSRVLAHPFETLIMAHGGIVRDDPRGRLAHALRNMLPVHAALPATTA